MRVVYISDDGRQFENAEECEAWEATLAEIRPIRQKLWADIEYETRIAYKYGPGEEIIRKEVQEEAKNRCTDATILSDENLSGYKLKLCRLLGDIKKTPLSRVRKYFIDLKNEYEYVFGD